jgi:inositol phosphorylceramide mannosyltransferase catalytic subunit
MQSVLYLLLLFSCSVSLAKTRQPGFDSGMTHLLRYDRLCKKYPKKWGRFKKLFRTYQKQSAKIKLEMAAYRIPKKIHMIWFGSKPPQFVQQMFQSWKNYHPGWEVKLWTEEDANQYPITNLKAFRKAKNYGEKSDIFRYEILEREGGIYVDADFECLQPFDTLCKTSDFFTGVGYTRAPPFVYNGLIGTRPHHPIMQRAIAELKEGNGDNGFQRILYATGPHHFTKCFINTLWPKNGLKPDCGTVVAFPVSYFYPFPDVQRGNYSDIEEVKRVWRCRESYAIHYWKISWQGHYCVS